ncbi:MAG: sensor histidine kinase, partial [Clostridia bacterium]|nr:sensor histidine kinase [Clostridia bacterium]
GGRAGVELSVADTGPGIPPEQRERLFDRFYRGDPSRSSEGAGLGLAIAQAILRAHGGRVEVESTVGRGSRFLLWLPRAAAATAAAAAGTEARGAAPLPPLPPVAAPGAPPAGAAGAAGTAGAAGAPEEASSHPGTLEG